MSDGPSLANEPLDGPGPSGPAETGRPVSAIVGVTVGKGSWTVVGLEEGRTTAAGGEVGGSGAGA